MTGANARSWVAFLAFVAAGVFFGFATFGESIGDVLLVPAGLFCVAIGAVIDHLPSG